MVCDLFTDGTVQVGSSIHMYTYLVYKPFANGLVCKCVPALRGKVSALFMIKIKNKQPVNMWKHCVFPDRMLLRKQENGCFDWTCCVVKFCVN